MGYRTDKEALKMLLIELKKYKFDKLFYDKSQTQSSDFFLEITENGADTSKYVLDEELENYTKKGFTFSKNALLSTELIQYMGSHFLKFINEFTLVSLDDSLINSELIIKTITQRDLELKSKGLKGINLSPGFKEFIRLLDSKSMDQIKECRIYERTTFYRYKKQLESIGYVRQSLLQRKIPFGKDFAEYYLNVNTEKFERNVKSAYFDK